MWKGLNMLKQKKTWILLADGESARLIEQDTPHSKLRQILHFDCRSIAQPNNQNFSKNLTPIVFFGRHTSEIACESTQKQQSQFAHDLVNYIKNANNNNKFDELYVFAPPSMLGYIRQNINHTNKKLRSTIRKLFNKDVIHLDLIKLKDYFSKVF